MKKSVVAKLEKLSALFKRHEEAVEDKFSAKQTAIFRYRIGAEDGAPHELTEVAEHFKCSISYVTKVVRDITKFAVDMDALKRKEKRADKPVRKVPVKGEGKKTGVRIAIMSAKIENGKVTVKHADPEVAAMVESNIQEMLDDSKDCGECDACVSNKAKMSIAEEAHKLNGKASTRGLWALLAAVTAVVMALVFTVKSGEFTNVQMAVGYGLVALVAFLGLVSYISGVSYVSKRDGLLEGLRRL